MCGLLLQAGSQFLQLGESLVALEFCETSASLVSAELSMDLMQVALEVGGAMALAVQVLGKTFRLCCEGASRRLASHHTHRHIAVLNKAMTPRRRATRYRAIPGRLAVASQARVRAPASKPG